MTGISYIYDMKPYKLLLLLMLPPLLTACEKTVPVSSVSVMPASMQMKVGEVWYLSVVVSPDNATDPSVFWETSDASVVMVDAGKVTAISPGSAKVSAIAVDGGKTGSCDITVIDPSCPDNPDNPDNPENPDIAATSITLSESELILPKAGTVVLTATLEPSNSTDKVTWSSSDTSVATVSKDGTVTAVSGGQAVITASAGSVSATATITVEVPVTYISPEHRSITLPLGQTYQASLIIEPEDATPKDFTVEWSMFYSSPVVFDVTRDGKVTATAIGVNSCHAKITYTHYDFATCAYVQVEDECVMEVVVVNEENGNHEGFDNENWD